MKDETNGPITISELKQTEARVRITLTGEESVLTVTSETALQWHLAKGVVLTPMQVELLRDESARLDARNSAIELLSRRDYSARHLESTLVRKGVSRQYAGAIVRSLVESGIVDDTSTALRLAERLVSHKPCGERYLEAVLMRHGYGSALAHQTAREILTGREEVSSAIRALRPRMNRLWQFELERARHKAYTFLSRRGFSYTAAETAFTQLWTERPADDQ